MGNQINKPNTYFNTLIYTGDGTDNRSITGLGFQPDFCWFKDRTGTNSHNLFDSVRGVQKPLISNATNAELTGYDLFDSFDSDGFTVSGATADNTNYNGSQFVSWSWKANGTGVSNTDGTITSTVSANTTSGFSIVSYSGNSTSGATIGHGLGVTPAMFIIKNRSAGEHWVVYHQSISPSNMLYLNLTNAQDPANQFNSTAPTANVFTVGSNIMVNATSNNYVAYCFAEKKGFSKFGSYTGNGSTDGTFVYTGFKPAMVIRKRTDAVQDWLIHDNRRTGINQASPYTSTLKPNVSAAELTGNEIDILSNGFKCRDTGTHGNASGGTYIYMAFAENPLVGTNNVPATAR